jgi:hypothetical protein
MGKVNKTKFWQASSILAPVTAVEEQDPAFLANLCPSGMSGKRCRYTDAAFAAFTSAVGSGDMYKYAAANTTDSITIDAVNPYFVYDGGASRPLSGEYVEKVGRTTGRTRGQVYKTCFDRIFNTGSDLVLLCTYRTDGRAQGGDSGSPAYVLLNGGKRYKTGIVWAGNSSAFDISLLSHVDKDGLSVWIY